MNYHHVVTQICNLLAEKQVWYESFEHEEVRTSEEASKVRHGYALEQGAKSLIVRIKKSGEKFFVMVVVRGSDRFNNSLFQDVMGTKDIRFASVEEVTEITGGVQVGGVPPFGTLFGLPVYIDRHVLDNEKIVFNAGDRRFSIAMKSTDYMTLVKPEVVSVV